MRNHHLGSLRNFPFSTAVMNISDCPGVTIHPAQPASPACAQINPVNMRSCWGRGHLGHLPGCLSPIPQQHPPTTGGLFGGFLGISSFKNFVLKNGSKEKGASQTGRHLYLHCEPVSSEPRKKNGLFFPSPATPVCPQSVKGALFPWTWNGADLPQQQLLPCKCSKTCLMVLQSCR